MKHDRIIILAAAGTAEIEGWAELCSLKCMSWVVKVVRFKVFDFGKNLDRQLLTQAWNSIHLWNEKGPASFLVPPPAPLPQSLSSTWSKEQSLHGQKVHWECVQGELTQEKCPPSSVEGRLLLHSSWTRNQYVIINIYGAGRDRKWIHTQDKVIWKH